MPRIILFEPEIPPNTGNIARTCAATKTPLHLVEPLGFEISDRTLKRAGLDYWPFVDLHRHGNWSDCLGHCHGMGGKLIGLSRHAPDSYLDYRFLDSDWLVFGRETSGLPDYVRSDCDAFLTVPLPCASVRSLNLSVAVAIVLFEALRQIKKPLLNSDLAI
ncbi:tRNA (cytidine(34)-2'-O)-methyltransferase [Synechococcus sp. UW140]|uniref:tRNA (cytidine(34)-2'-O)-methyltransferase n=1 Tax=Synechococcus sp. UW140 TaxID=368503 RepID=UPI003137FFDA